MHNDNIGFIKIRKNDLIAYSAAKIKVIFDTEKIQAMFIDDSINRLSSVTNEFEGEFDYISFCPVSTKIYKAINECDVISLNTTVPQIINTFDNNYQVYSEDIMYYTIESLNEDFDVNFNFNNGLYKYSIDSYPITISKKDSSNLNFSFEDFVVSYESILGNTIEIPDFFTVNRDKIEVARYIISNEDLDIQYLNKNSDKLHERDYQKFHCSLCDNRWKHSLSGAYDTWTHIQEHVCQHNHRFEHRVFLRTLYVNVLHIEPQYLSKRQGSQGTTCQA